jgi:hypothetical protein
VSGEQWAARLRSEAMVGKKSDFSKAEGESFEGRVSGEEEEME